jgi:uncharacterized membrane protein
MGTDEWRIRLKTFTIIFAVGLAGLVLSFVMFYILALVLVIIAKIIPPNVDYIP